MCHSKLKTSRKPFFVFLPIDLMFNRIYTDYEKKFTQIANRSKNLAKHVQNLVSTIDGMNRKVMSTNSIVTTNTTRLKRQLEKEQRNDSYLISQHLLTDFFVAEVSEENRQLFTRLVKDTALNFDSDAKKNIVRNIQ